MVRFLEQEAKEKAEEIRTLAESEADARKVLILEEKKKEIEEKFIKLKENIKTEQKIQKSQKVSESRIKTMRDRDEKMNEVKSAVLERMVDVHSNPQYPALIMHLICEGFLRMQERKVIVQCREMDKAIVEAQLPLAIAKFTQIVKSQTGVDFPLNATLSSDYLAGPPREGYSGCRGGVVLSARGRRIILRNTLDSRLGTVFQQLSPSLRALLFGEREQFANTVSKKGFH
jgi:V-type H+-transporting ATPase subunit E